MDGNPINRSFPQAGQPCFDFLYFTPMNTWPLPSSLFCFLIISFSPSPITHPHSSSCFIMSSAPPKTAPKGKQQVGEKENTEKQRQSEPEEGAPEWAQNDVEHPVLKVFDFHPNRLGREWPPNPQQPEDIQLGRADKHKTLGDLDWLQTAAEAIPVREQVPLRGKLNAQWPPPEKEYRVEVILPEGVQQQQ